MKCTICEVNDVAVGAEQGSKLCDRCWEIEHRLDGLSFGAVLFFLRRFEAMAADRALHPFGRCTCAGEGRCEWCVEPCAHGQKTRIGEDCIACAKDAGLTLELDATDNAAMEYEAIIFACARAAHEANRIYCESLGDTSQLHWEEAPDWQRESAIEGVRQALKGASSEDLHRSWMEAKARDGWVYGPTKDPEKKEHPCMVPYNELPIEQRKKDDLFGLTVRAMRTVLIAPVA